VQVEHRVLRRACHLAPKLQRLLFGAPPIVDGQRLADDMQALLRLGQISGLDTLTGGLPPAQARLYNRRGTALSAGPPRPLARVEDITFRGAETELPARHYVPFDPPPAPAPLLVYFHGGGFVIGDLDTQDSACRFLAAMAGIPVLSMEYRLSPEHPFPAGVEDAHAGFRWATRNAAELGADPARIAVGGDSAGANLAAVACHLARGEDEPPPAMQLLLYPPTDLAARHRSRRLFCEGFLLTERDILEFERHYLPTPPAADDWRASVLDAEDVSNLPPAYLAVGGFDPFRDETEDYARRMREAGVRVVLRRHRGLVHGFANFTAVSPSARAAMHEAAGALRMGLA
jgi:acetyl esterase